VKTPIESDIDLLYRNDDASSVAAVQADLDREISPIYLHAW
jgi:hypothetical protein